MSQVIVTDSNAAPSKGTINVTAPHAGQKLKVSALAASELQLGFDPAQAIVVREGTGLAFISDTGGKVLITDFFSVGEGPLPTMVLPDGSRVGAADWLAVLYPDMDLSTAAGPSATAPQSGGANYADDAGSLLGGVDKFGDQEGSGGWGSLAPRMNEISPAERLVSLATGVAAEAGGGGSVDPDDGDGGEEPKPYTPLNTLHVHHYDPVRFTNSEGEPNPKGEYDYTARMATGAAGVGETADGTEVPGAWDKGDFSLDISADNAAMIPAAGTAASVVSGVFAANGGRASINAGNIDIDVTGQGFEGGSGSSVVGAVFAQGAMEEGARGNEDHRSHHAEVTLKADGDINLAMSITGDTEMQDHSRVTYAAVAASDRAHAGLESGEDVSITVTDQTSGGTLDAPGVYGIYSGYGLREPDLPKREDFVSDDDYGYAYEYYMDRLRDQYREDTERTWEGDRYVRGTDQSLVDIKAAGNLDVTLDMGSTEGPVSGLRLEYGDARITAGGDINFSTTLRGIHNGEGLAKASAVSITDGGRLGMSADGDVNLSLHGDGRNMSVLHIGNGPIANGDDYPHSSENHCGKIHGQNVNITGTAGANGAADVNEIVGLEMGGKKNKFLLTAEDKITIDVTTFHHGNAGSATGILVHPGVAEFADHHLFMNTPEVEVAARIKPAGTASEGRAHDTTATALRVDGAYVHMTRGEESESEDYISNDGPMEKLSLIAEGGRWNYGINVVTSGDEHFYSQLELQADELNIRAAGGVADGESGSYGVVAKGERDGQNATVNLQVGKLSMTVENPTESVGLLADRGNLNISGAWDHQTGEAVPLTVIISCTITDPSVLPDGARAVAIEALNGGDVNIVGSDNWWEQTGTNDSVVLNGDVIARGENHDYYNPGSSISIHLGYGSDSVTVNGNIAADEKGGISIDTGNGSDRIEINGDIMAGGNSSVSIDTGKGNDVLIFSGTIHASDGVNITGGGGHDLLVLKAVGFQAFEDQFKDWLESGALNTLSCESFIIHGVDATHAPSWFSNLSASHPEINVQYYSADTSLILVNTAEQLSAAFSLDGSGSNDLLYLRFDGDADQGLRNLQEAVHAGRVSGLEKLVLDIANGHNDGNLDSDLFNGMIGQARGNGTEVHLRADTMDSALLQNAGWTTLGNTTTIDGTEYTVYSHSELGDMYVKLLTTG